MHRIRRELLDDLEQFLYHESALLDAADWNGWQDLFTDEGTYWMPLDPQQPDAVNHVSLIYDNRTLMHLRCKRLSDATDVTSLSLHPFPRVLRYLSNVTVSTTSPETLEARANLLAVHHAAGLTQQLYGRVRWTLSRTATGPKIIQKRVDLVTAGSPLRDILVYL